MIPSDQGLVLDRKLHSYIAQGGSRQNAGLVATVLNSANTITDILVSLPGSRMSVAPVGHGVWTVLDRTGTEVLTFRLTEEPRGAKVEIVEGQGSTFHSAIPAGGAAPAVNDATKQRFVNPSDRPLRHPGEG